MKTLVEGNGTNYANITQIDGNLFILRSNGDVLLVEPKDLFTLSGYASQLNAAECQARAAAERQEQFLANAPPISSFVDGATGGISAAWQDWFRALGKNYFHE